MKTRSLALGAAAAVAGLLVVAPAAGAHTRNSDRNTTASMQSCVDVNNDGACTPGTDPPLMQYMQNGMLNTNTLNLPPTAAVKKTKKAGTTAAPKIGVVLDNANFSGTLTGGAQIIASGSIHVNGNLKSANDGFLNLTTSGDLDIAAGAKIKAGEFGGTFQATNGGSVHIGEGASITAHDDVDHITIAGNNVTVDDGATITVVGYNSSLAVHADGVLTVGKNVTMATSGRDEGPAATRIDASSDITLDHATLGGRGVEVLAHSATGTPRHIAVTNSKITIPHGDGTFRLDAEGDEGATVHLVGNTMSPANAAIDSTPAAS